MLALTIAAEFAVNLTPFKIVGSFDAGMTELVAGLGFHIDDSISVSLVQRLLVYAPLGFLAYATIALRGIRFPFLGAVLIVAMVGVIVELLQSFLSVRQAFTIDVFLVLIVGVLTALTGEIVAGLMAGRRIAFLQMLVLGNIVALSAIWLAHRGSELASWDCGYPLIIGNETTSDRPWLGEIRGFAVYARALKDDDVQTLSRGFDASGRIDRRQLGARLLKSFDEDHELRLERPAVIEAARDPSFLCEAIKKAEAFTIEIEFASLDLDQRGPARILSMSRGPEKRNVTIGQDGGRLLLRIRNELNGDNGIEQQIRTADGVVTGDWQHWIARYDRGVTTLFLDGAMLSPSLDYESILLVSGRTSLPLAVICGVLSMMMGAAAYAWLGRDGAGRARRRMLIAAVIALLPQAVMALVIVMTSQRLPAAAVSGTVIVSALVGVVGAHMADRSRWRYLAREGTPATIAER